MAKFSRYLAGGIIGAGLALLFSPKSGREIRRMLMGTYQKALPAPEEYYQPTPPTPAGAAAVDLEAKIEETRMQVEAQLEEVLATAAVEEEAAVLEEAVVEEKAEEEIIEEAPETGPPVPPVPEGEAEMEFPAEEAEESEAEQLVPGEEKESVADITSAGVKAWEELKAPAEGEPALEAELTLTPEAEEAVPPAPMGIDREEMRRRIDETRARLKAKAFDAMVSGETFIGNTGEKGGGREKAAEPELEKEVEDQINESLKEQD